MKNKDLKSIELQLKKDPHNISLKLRYGKLLLKAQKIRESEVVYQSILKNDPENIQAKQGLTTVYFEKGNYSTVIVIAEDLASKNQSTEKIKVLHIKSLLKQNSMEEAQVLYNKLISDNPFLFDDELMDVFEDSSEIDKEAETDKKSTFFDEDDDFDDFDDDDDDFDDDDYYSMDPFLDQQSKILEILENNILIRQGYSSFDNVLGMNDVKKLMKFKFSFFTDNEDILLHNDRESRGSMMMYGPTGTGKSHIMKAFVKEFYCPLIPIELSHSHLLPIIDKNRLLTLLFSQAQIVKPVTIFIDHLEVFAPSQIHNTEEDTIRTLQSLESGNIDYSQVGIVAATNKPWMIDPEIFRFGRIDDVVFTSPPNSEERVLFFEEHLFFYHKGLKKHLDELVAATKGFTIAELEHMIDKALYFNGDGNTKPSPLKITAVRNAIKKIDPVIKYWLDDLAAKVKGNQRLNNLFEDALNFKVD